MIKAYNLNKYYNKNKSNQIHVINDISIALPDTGLITFLGQSGSGKTTLLNVLGGLDKATGTIEYDSITFKKYDMHKIDKIRNEKIGYIFQNYNLILNETIYQNLASALYAINVTDEDEVKKRSDYALKAVGLYHYRKKLASALSGGQMQRVSIARCLVKNSSIIIADEPTGNLDSNNSIEIMNILKKISSKALVLLVTHDKGLAEYFSDRIIEIQDGTIIKFRDTDTENTKLKTNDNNIYLKDLNEIKENNITYYLENDTKEKPELTIVEHNNTFYLKSNVKIKLLEDTTLNLIDAKYEDKINVCKEDFNYDTSWYSSNLKSNKFKIFLRMLKESFFNFFYQRKRTKFFHFAMFLIGIIIAFINISYASYNYIDKDTISYDPDVYVVKNAHDKSVQRILENAKTNSYINESYYSGALGLYLTYYTNSYTSVDINISTLYTFNDSLINENKIIEGNMPSNTNEIVITKKVADYIINQINKNLNYASLIGLKNSNYYSYDGTSTSQTIVGIVDKDGFASYTHSLASSEEFSYDALITTSNVEKLRQYLKNNNLELQNLYDCKYNTLKKTHQEDRANLIPRILILLSITLIYIYFAMRAKMLNDIYNIGVYRAIGFSRSKITAKYVIEISVMTFFTTSLGYILTSVIYSYIIKKINNLITDVGGSTRIVISNQPSTYIVWLLIFVASVLTGILPIYMLMRKTPSEILAKYDI